MYVKTAAAGVLHVAAGTGIMTGLGVRLALEAPAGFPNPVRSLTVRGVSRVSSSLSGHLVGTYGPARPPTHRTTGRVGQVRSIIRITIRAGKIKRM